MSLHRVIWLLGIPAGVLSTLLFRRLADRPAMRAAANAIFARLLEMRLYFDDPRTVWRAQRALLRWNARWLKLALLPTLAAAIPMLLAYWIADRTTPLPSGQARIFSAPLPDDGDTPQLLGATPETPAVRSLADRRVSWRTHTNQLPQVLYKDGHKETARLETPTPHAWFWPLTIAAFAAAMLTAALL